VLPAADQPTFRNRVHEQLEAVGEIGDGVLFRVCAQAQRELFRPPSGMEYREARLLRRFS
jgi:hypothetical protein